MKKEKGGRRKDAGRNEERLRERERVDSSEERRISVVVLGFLVCLVL